MPRLEAAATLASAPPELKPFVKVGLVREARYTERTLTLEEGDVLLAYTDGINEAMTASAEEWGDERMVEAARSAQRGGAAEIVRAVFDGVERFTAGAPQHDDMTLLALKLSSQADACGAPG